MSAVINVAGASPVWVDTGSAHALELLGYTRDGGQIRFVGYPLDVQVDDNGGEAGPPSDVQLMGDSAVIDLELTKWDEAIADKLRPRAYGGTAGVVPSSGILLIGGGFSYRVVILSPTRPCNFPVTLFRDPHEINKGSKFSTFRLAGTAYKNGSSVLYNATTS